ncbi:MAG: cytidylate kinase family protein [Pseudomonadota bacterium]
MPIVIISSCDEETRRLLAQNLARKMACPSVSREEVVEQATEAGIPVAKMEMAVLKRSTPRERLARHKNRLMAFITASVCQRASQGDMVYHGRACHMLLKRVGHVLRVQVVPEPEVRLQRVMRDMKLSRDKAEGYIKELDSDIAAWVSFAHGVEASQTSHYDLTINLEHMSLESASAVIYQMAQMPDFQRTIASERAINELWLAAQARDILGRDERTGAADLTVTAAEGRVTVTYMPSQGKFAEAIPVVLAGLAGAKEIICTMASSNILWVAEAFDPRSQTFAEIVDVAQRWGAGVEMLCLRAPADDPAQCQPTEAILPEEGAPIPKSQDQTCGIEDDAEVPRQTIDTTLAAAREELIQRGRYGGSQISRGLGPEVIQALNPNQEYALVVIGDLFKSKEPSVRTRLTREMAGYLSERIKPPVITGDTLQDKFLFGKRQMARLGLLLASVVLIYLVAFTNQEPILRFFGGHDGGSFMRALAVLVLASVVPAVAYLYGGATGLILKWLKFE